MKKGLYAIKDELTGFSQVMTEDSDQVAYRNFAFAANSNESLKFNFKHYSLYKLGSYDSELGLIEAETPKLIIDAASVIRKENNG